MPSGFVSVHDVKNKFQCVKINFKQEDFSMMIILPVAKDGFDAVPKCVNDKVIRDLRNSKFSYRYLKLQLPKFKVEMGMDLNSHFQSLGIENVFESSANFSKMTSDNLYISEVFHMAVVEVCEEATEVSAAPGVKFPRYEEPGTSINVNHPFMFTIQDKKRILFVGKVNALPSC